MKKKVVIFALSVVLMLSFTICSFAEEQEGHVIMPIRGMTFYWYDNPGFKPPLHYETSSESPLHADVGQNQSSILHILIDGTLSQFIPAGSTSAWIQFDVVVASEALKGSDVPPFYGITAVQFMEDLTTDGYHSLSSVPVSQVDSSGEPYISIMYQFKDKRGNTRLVDSAGFAEWFMQADTSNPYITFSFFLKVSNSYLVNYPSVIRSSNILRIQVNNASSAGGYLDISPTVSMYYTENVITAEDQYNQVNDMINGGYGDSEYDPHSIAETKDNINVFEGVVEGALDVRDNAQIFNTLTNLTRVVSAEAVAFFRPFFENFQITIGGYSFNPLLFSMEFGVAITSIELILSFLLGANDFRKSVKRTGGSDWQSSSGPVEDSDGDMWSNNWSQGSF